VQYKIDLHSLLVDKEELFKDLQDKHTMLTFDLNIEHLKTKLLEKDHIIFRTSYKVAANQTVTNLNLTISTLKEVAKSTKKS
jgi:hypothetical protein